MKRPLWFDVLAGMSLVLCIATLAICTATFDQTSFHTFGHLPALYAIGSRSGVVSLGRMQFPPSPRDPHGDAKMMATWRQTSGGNGDVLSLLGFNYYDEPITPNNIFYGEIQSFKVFTISHSAIAAIAGILPAVWIYRATRQRTAKRTTPPAN